MIDFVSCINGAGGKQLSQEDVRKISVAVSSASTSGEWRSVVKSTYGAPSEQNQAAVIQHCMDMTAPPQGQEQRMEESGPRSAVPRSLIGSFDCSSIGGQAGLLSIWGEGRYEARFSSGCQENGAVSVTQHRLSMRGDRICRNPGDPDAAPFDVDQLDRWFEIRIATENVLTARFVGASSFQGEAARCPEGLEMQRVVGAEPICLPVALSCRKTEDVP
jgi:hypothetical protein